MKKSQLRHIIREQIKQVPKPITKGKDTKLQKAPITKPYVFKGGPTQAYNDKKFIDNGPILPPNNSSTPAIGMYVCVYFPATGDPSNIGGYGNGCYELNSYTIPGYGQQLAWFNPTLNNNGSQSGFMSSCVPWHQGGNCYGALHLSDFPISTPNGPVTSPPERACNEYCSVS
jgi:hypothetical protein